MVVGPLAAPHYPARLAPHVVPAPRTLRLGWRMQKRRQAWPLPASCLSSSPTPHLPSHCRCMNPHLRSHGGIPTHDVILLSRQARKLRSSNCHAPDHPAIPWSLLHLPGDGEDARSDDALDDGLPHWGSLGSNRGLGARQTHKHTELYLGKQVPAAPSHTDEDGERRWLNWENRDHPLGFSPRARERKEKQRDKLATPHTGGMERERLG